MHHMMTLLPENQAQELLPPYLMESNETGGGQVSHTRCLGAKLLCRNKAHCTNCFDERNKGGIFKKSKTKSIILFEYLFSATPELCSVACKCFELTTASGVSTF